MEILPFDLPATLDEFDAEFMTKLLRHRGVISATNEVVKTEDADVGMTAGYFSALKKVKCFYKEETNARTEFAVKTWPPFEILPREAIKAMFVKDIKGYTDFEADEFFPRPDTVLAAYDEDKNRWALVMEDADAFAEHKVHESELTMDEVQSMIPQLVDQAVHWEGCHEGPNADKLAAIGIEHWASTANLDIYKAVMARGAPFFDKFINTETMGTPSWDSYLGPNFSVEYTKRVGAFFTRAQPSQSATCTLAHGDLRGDNIFFTPKGPRFPHGWLVIDFQLMFRGPIPSDLAYLMNSGSVLPEVYTGENLKTILRAFHDGFKTKTHVYKGVYPGFPKTFADAMT